MTLSSLEVSGDGFIQEFEAEKAKVLSPGLTVVPGVVHMPAANMQRIGDVLRAGAYSPAVLRTLEHTSTSLGARLGFEVGVMHAADALQMEDDLLIPVDFHLHAGEDRNGGHAENPLIRHLPLWLQQQVNVACVRLFSRDGVRPFTVDRIEEEVASGRMMLTDDAIRLEESVVLPVNPRVRYPLRHDLMTEQLLREALTGGGRGVIGALQPSIPEPLALRPDAYGIGATHFSMLHNRGVLGREMVDLKTGLRTDRMTHGTSRVWDGTKTTGIHHDRQLEVRHAQGAENEANAGDYGAELHIYPSHCANGVTTRATVSDPHGVLKRGLSIDDLLDEPRHAEGIRAALDELCADPDLWGVVVSPSGQHLIPAERHAVQQEQALRVAAHAYTRNVRKSNGSERFAALDAVGEYLSNVGDYRQRAALFCRRAPSQAALMDAMAKGIRVVFTPNISGDESALYLSNSQHQHYKQLTQHGLQLYLVTPSCVRKLWHDLLVRIESLERVQSADVRIGGYAASADGSEKIIEKGGFLRFLERCKRDYPDAALVTGGAPQGGMGYLNRVASELGITTIGIGTYIPGQENPGDDADAVMLFERSTTGFANRQALMAQIMSFPVVNIGAEGTGFEEALERVLRKIGLGPLSLMMYIDPQGLGKKGKHMWGPITQLEHSFTRPVYLPDMPGFSLSRSPYVQKLLVFGRDYLRAYESCRPYLEDPLEYLRRIQVPETVIASAVASMKKDAASTGFPMHAFWKDAAREF